MAEKKIPFVAAMSVLTNSSYDSCLEKYNGMTEAERINSEETYLENNMGYGPDAWNAYCDAKRARGETW